MASMVTTVPVNSSAFSSLGMAVISLDFSSTLRCASTRPLPSAQDETMWTRVFLPVSRVPHNAFPSMATTSPAVSLAIDETQATKPFSISSGSSAAKTRLNVSCDGIPDGSVKNVFNHSKLSSPYSAMSFQLSAPFSTAAIEIRRISSSKCSRFRSTRGSRNSAKYLRGFSISPCRLSTSPFLTVEMSRPASRVSGKFLGKEIAFFRGDKPTVWYALAGVDMETAPGTYDLGISAVIPAHGLVRAVKKIEVRSGEFKEGTAEVPENYVNPDDAE